MENVVQQLRELREYAPDERAVFYFTPIFDQDFLNKIYPMTRETRVIVLCDKQKKLKTPLENLENIEVLDLHMTRLALVPNKFCPRHARLRGAELEQMQKHYKNLPVLLATDPMSIIHGFRLGDIIKIYRLDGSIYYKRVEA